MDAQTGANREVMSTGLAQHSVCALHTPAMVCSQVGWGFIWDLGSKEEDLWYKEEILGLRKRNCSVRGPNTTAAPGVQAPHSQWEVS